LNSKGTIIPAPRPPKRAPTARGQAAAVLNAVLLEGRSLTQALEDMRAAHPHADPRMLGAVQNHAYEVLRNFGRLRFFLDRLAGREVDPPELNGILLVGLSELDAGDSPDYAAVNEAVNLAGLHFPRARGFVNALLRNFLRRRETLSQAAAADPEACWNFPVWWQARLQAAYPAHWQSVLTALNTHPPMTLRVNLRRVSLADYQAKLAEGGLAARVLSETALMLERPVPVAELPGFRSGWVSVQDLGAQLAAPLLDTAPGMRVLDACAAPGGKTAHLLERQDLEVVALDVDKRRLGRVQDTLERLDLKAELVAADAVATRRWWDGRAFDRILLDAPCTASGVVRRHPDGKWLKRPADATGLATQQQALLEALWPLLRPGGKLLYATCSLFPEENSRQVAQFLSRHPDARREPMDIPGAEDGQLLPDQDHDGFFYARIVKT